MSYRHASASTKRRARAGSAAAQASLASRGISWARGTSSARVSIPAGQRRAIETTYMIQLGKLSYGQLTPQQRSNITKYFNQLSPSMRRAYTKTKGEYTIQKAAKGIFKYTPLGFSLFAAEKIVEKGKELKEEYKETAGEYMLPTAETIKWAMPPLTPFVKAGEHVGTKGMMWITEGVKQREVAEQIATTGFGIGGGKTYGQREAEIKAGLGLTDRTLEEYTQTLSGLASAPEVTEYKEGFYGEVPKSDIVKQYQQELKHITQYETKYGEGAFEKHLGIFSKKVEAVAQLSEFAMRSEVPPTEPSGTWGEAPDKFSFKKSAILLTPVAPFSIAMGIAMGKPYEYTKPIFGLTQKGLEKYHKFLYEKAGWGAPLPKTPVLREFVGMGRYVAEKTPEFLSFFPMAIPAGEAVFREPTKMAGALVPGAIFMGRGMAREFYKEPVGFAAAMIAMAGIIKGATKASPLKPVSLRVPTGKGQIKTWHTIGKGLPGEYKALQEIAGYKTPLEMGKIETTRIPSIYKQTHLIPEAVTYRGVYFKTPSQTPYKGKHFLFGRISGPPGTQRGWQIGQPKFELPASYRVFTGLEAAATLPSMKGSLPLEQQRLMTEMFFLRERLYGRKGLVKPMRFEDIGTFEGMPEGFRTDVAVYLRKHRRSVVFYGSGAKEAQIARLAGERGGISPADIDFEIRTLAARMSEGIILPKRWQSAYTLGELGKPTWKSQFIKRIGEKVPGLTPEKMAKDLTAIAEKYMGKEKVITEYQPTWQMFSVKKILGAEKTPWGKEPITEALFDIHPESGMFEFGIKPQRPIKTTIETGIPSESWWARHQKIRMTTLSEEFDRSFASIMQTQMKGSELYLAPRFRRLKDITRGVQTGKMLSEYGGLKIKMDIMPFKKQRLKGISEEATALKHLEEYGSTFKELREFQGDMTAEAISASAENILRQQRVGASLFGSEAATLFPKRIKFGEAYKPEIGKQKPKVDVGKDYYEGVAEYYAAYGYPARPSGYYGAGYYYGTPSYYGKPGYRVTPPSRKVLGFIPTSPIRHIPTPQPIHIIPIARITTPPPRHHVTPTPSVTTVSTPPVAPTVPPPPFMPIATPPTPPTPPPTPPPTLITITTPPPPPPPTTPPPFIVTLPPLPIIPIVPFLDEEKKPRKKKKLKRKEREWYERHYIPTIEELMKTPKGTKLIQPSMLELPNLEIPKL